MFQSFTLRRKFILEFNGDVLTPLTLQALGRPVHMTGETDTVQAVRLVLYFILFRPPSPLATLFSFTCYSRAHPKWDNLPTFRLGFLILFDKFLYRLST